MRGLLNCFLNFVPHMHLFYNIYSGLRVGACVILHFDTLPGDEARNNGGDSL